MTSRPRELSIAFQTDKRPDEYRRLAGMVEEFGFDALSMYSDLTFQPPIVPLTIAAVATRRIRLGPASLNPFSLHPVEIAGQIATLDMASGGRAYLGVSRGAWLDAIGIEQRRPIARVLDTLEAVGYLLSGGEGGYQGRTLEIDPGVRLRYQPERSAIPLMLGAWGRRLISRAAALVDEVKIGGSANPDIIPLALDWAERDGEHTPGIVMGAVTIVDEDGDVARRLIRREMALYLPVVAPLDPTVEVDPELLARVGALVDAGDLDGAGALIPEDLLRRFSFAGTPADIIEQCEALFDAGAARIEFGTPHGRTAERGLDLLGHVVLPALGHWRE